MRSIARQRHLPELEECQYWPGASGSRTMTRSPCGKAGSSATVPPWRNTISLAMDKPRPQPAPTSVARTNRPNTSPRKSAAIPGPYYERGPWALRTSYNYRDRHAQSRSEVGINQSLNSMSIWKPERGLLDASISYKFNDNLEFRVDGMNLNNEKTFLYYKDMLGRYGDDRARTDDLIYDGRTIQLGLRGSF